MVYSVDNKRKIKITKSEAIIAVIPERFRANIGKALQSDSLEEIRFRTGHSPELTYRSGPRFLTEERFHNADAAFVINQLSQHSVYAFEEELRNGFLTLPGGHRVGLGGEAVVENSQVKTLKHIRSFNIRIARQMNGVADRYLSTMYQKRWLNTLIIGPPQSGKTTLLRDLARTASVGNEEKGIFPSKVGIVDERSELAAAYEGVPQHDLGPRADVLDRCPKAEGMMMLIRAMSPEVLIVDEIGSERDKIALKEAMNAGVSVICSAHGRSKQDIQARDLLAADSGQPLFEGLLFLNKDKKGEYYFPRKGHST